MAIPKNTSGGDPRKPIGGGGLPTGRERPGLPSQRTGLPSTGGQRPNGGRPQSGGNTQPPEQRTTRGAPNSPPSGSQRHSPGQEANNRGSGQEDPLEGFNYPEERRRPPSQIGEQYDFEERSRAYENAREIRKEPEPFVNEFDNEEDDTFSSISVDEQLDYEDDEDNQSNRSTHQPKPVVQELPQPVLIDEDEDDDDEEDDENPAEIRKRLKTEEKERLAQAKKDKARNRKDDNGQDVFINQKKNTLKTFGGRKINQSEFDKRKNLRKNATIVKIVVIGLITLLVGAGVKNAIFPPEVMTENEIAEIVAATTGLNDYPLEKGKGFATDFMKSYLTANADGVSEKVLGYYYSGSLTVGATGNRTVTSAIKQNVLYGPTVYDAYAFSDNSARYTIGALVSNSAVEGKTPAQGSAPRWEFFNVNVYYDKKTDSFAITQDSPTVIPAANVGQAENIPKAMDLGTGVPNADLVETVDSVVKGFIQGYLTSSPDNHTAIDQYITSVNDPELIKGLDGAYKFAGDSVNESIKYEVYPMTEENNNELKVLATLDLANTLGTDKSTMSVQYKSTYVITLKLVGGKYLVSKIAPQYYVTDEEFAEAEAALNEPVVEEGAEVPAEAPVEEPVE